MDDMGVCIHMGVMGEESVHGAWSMEYEAWAG